MFGSGVENRQAPPAGIPRHLDENLVAGLGDVDRYENDAIGDKIWLSHGRSVSEMRLRTPSS
jgi:hypothetical protein